MATTRIFVSHSHADNAFCRTLVKALQNAGADVWYDEHNMGPGHLMKVIQEELRARSIFMVILSAAALHSNWVEDETTWFYDLYRTDASRVLLPILATSVDPNDIWLFIRSFKRVEAGNTQPYPQAEAIRRALLAVGLTPQEENSMADQFAETLAAYDRILALDPKDAGAWSGKAATYYDMQQLEKSLDAWNHYLAIKPDAVGWWNKGIVLVNLGRNEEAIPALERSIEIDPTPAKIWGDKGIALMNLQRYYEALLAFNRALEIESAYTTVLLYKGQVLKIMARYEEALEVLNQLLAIEPTNIRALREQAEVLKALKR